MNVQEFLREKHVEYHPIVHAESRGAQHLAEELHVPGRIVAKTVLLRADSGFAYIVAVLPATKSIDFEKLSKAIGGSKLELATEVDMNEHCPDCEMGTLPPFGSQYAMQTIVDESLKQDVEIVFEANSHHEAIRMRYDDYHRIERPLVANFATEMTE